MDMFALVEQENKELNVAPDDLIFSSRWPLSKKRLCTPAGASSGKPDSNSLDCIVFFLLCGVL